MRRAALTAITLTTMLLAGCTDDSPNGDSDGPTPIIAEGASLGTWTHSMEGGPLVGIEVPQPDLDANCNTLPTAVGSHPFTVPADDGNGVAWRASSLTITITHNNQANLELDLYFLDGDDVRASNTQSDLMGESPYTLEVTGITPGDYTIEVHACSPAPAGYTLDLTGTMVAAEDVFDESAP